MASELSNFFGILPDEILLVIIEYVDQQSQNKLSLCSKKLCRITRPILFSRVDASHTDTVPLFLGTALEKPEFCSYVRAFTIRIQDIKTSSLSKNNRILLSENRLKFNTALRQRNFIDQLYLPGNFGAVMAILLYSLPLLEDLSMDLGKVSYGGRWGELLIEHQNFKYMIWRFSKALLPDDTSIELISKNLKNIKINCDGNTNFLGPWIVLFLSLVSATTLTLVGDLVRDGGGDAVLQEPGIFRATYSSRVTVLRLRRFTVKESFARRLLEAFSALKELHIHGIEHSVSDYGVNGIGTLHLLQPQIKHCLEILVFHDPVFERCPVDAESEWPIMVSLLTFSSYHHLSFVDFEVLQVIDIPAYLLLNTYERQHLFQRFVNNPFDPPNLSQLLPRSLRRLIIRFRHWPDNKICDGLGQLVKNKETHLPSFTKFDIYYADSKFHHYYADSKYVYCKSPGLKNICDEHGVEFGLF